MNHKVLAYGNRCMIDLNTMENWLPVKGYEKFYEVSDLGRVRSLDRDAISMRRRSDGIKRPSLTKYKGRILRPGIGNNGYFKLSLCIEGNQITVSVHKLVATAFPRGEGPIVRHLDGNRLHNHASNLMWGTWEDNEIDKDIHGRVPHGESHPNSKFTARDIRAIRSLTENGFSESYIARLFQVSRYSIYSVRKELTWKRLKS